MSDMKIKIYLVYGEEKYLIDNFSSKIIDKNLKKEYLDFNYNFIDYKKNMDFNIVSDNIETLPLFDNSRIVIINDLDLSKNGISLNKKFTEDLNNYLNKIPDHSILIINSYNDKVFKGKLYKNIEKIGKIINYNKLEYKELSTWIKNFFKENKLDISSDLVDYIIDKSAYLNKDLNKNLYDLNNELLKFNKFSGGISKGNIDSIFTSSFESNIFKLTDAVSHRDISKSLEIYSDILKNSDDPFRIFYMIVRLIRNILTVKESIRIKKRDIDISREYSISTFEIKKLKGVIKLWKYDNLKKAIHSAYKTEIMLKSTSIPSIEIVENYILEIIK